ncbi:MAG TPA: hypothetical protein VIJ93_07245 [bacterium]|jgi:hypothetical protein
MKKTLYLLLCVGFLCLPLSGCSTLSHTVGNGGTGNTEVASERQWYILWGLVPLGNVDGGEMAKKKGLTTNYTVKSQVGFVDVLLNIITSIVTINGQTVSVTK